MTYAIELCPNCGSHEVTPVEEPEYGDFFVYCYGCDNVGDYRRTMDDAILSWNFVAKAPTT